MQTKSVIENLGTLIEKTKGDHRRVLFAARHALEFTDERLIQATKALKAISELPGDNQAHDYAEEFLMDSSVTKCNGCQGDFSLDREGGVQGYFGIIPVAFCPTCKVGAIELGESFNYQEEEDAELIEALQDENAELKARIAKLESPET